MPLQYATRRRSAEMTGVDSWHRCATFRLDKTHCCPQIITVDSFHPPKSLVSARGALLSSITRGAALTVT
jgi:hypothetical protein